MVAASSQKILLPFRLLLCSAFEKCFRANILAVFLFFSHPSFSYNSFPTVPLFPTSSALQFAIFRKLVGMTYRTTLTLTVVPRKTIFPTLSFYIAQLLFSLFDTECYKMSVFRRQQTPISSLLIFCSERSGGK